MIEILPMTDRKREADILQKHGPDGDKARVLLMTERGAELGFIAVELVGRTLILLECYTEPASDTETAFFMDTLVRSAASYGETNGADAIETRSPAYNEFLKTMGFQWDESHAFTPMSTIVHYS